MKNLLLIVALLIFCNAAKAQITIATRGNSYVTSSEKKGAKITRAGVIENWTSPNAEISTYFKVAQGGNLDLAIRVKNGGEPSKMRIFVEGQVFNITVRNPDFETIKLGSVQLFDSGYVQVKVQGISKRSDTFGTFESFEIGGTATEKGVANCGDFDPYWANRGPSVHFKYTLPAGNTEYFYNEVTVTEGNDIVGSYYMANGFGEGYFGMQVNSSTERRILFSVWSPFDTQDPASIPDSLKIKLLIKGEGVTVGEFGNEGSGGQSYLRYNWITGNTYRFLMRVHPDGNDNTIYTAYFYAPEIAKWQVIASFLRPKTNTYYTHAYSFLENFSPTQGYLERRVEFSNQWACSADGIWNEITDATFTYDATAKAGARKDYSGLLEHNSFILRNCGFFNDNTEYNTKFSRNSSNAKPDIDFSILESL